MARQVFDDLRDPTWQIITRMNLAGGLNTLVPADQIADEETPDSLNLTWRGDRVRVDTGYVKFSDTTRGNIKGIFQHQTAAGVVTTICVTDATFYKCVLVSGVRKWHYVSDGNESTLSANEAAGQVDISVSDTAPFTVNDYVGIALNDGNQHQTTVSAIPTPGAPGVITIADQLPSDADAPNAIVKALDLAGDDDHQVVFAPVPSHQWTAFTNGVNYPHRYDGSTVEPISGLPYSGNIVCGMMVVYNHSLVLLNIIENGVDKPYLVMWSEFGDPETWTGGNAGNNPLIDARDAITAAKTLGKDLIIYRSNGIVRMSFVGGLNVFNFIPVSQGEATTTEGVGACSPNAVFSSTNTHIFLSRKGVFEYSGGLSVEVLSDKTYFGAFDESGDVDQEKLHRAFVHYSDRLEELFVFYADTTNSFPTTAYIYSLPTGRWRKRSFSHTFTCSGSIVDSVAPRWIDLVGQWLQQSWSWRGLAFTGTTPTIALGGYGTQAYEYNYVTPDEDGVDISWYLYTKKFRYVDREGRHDCVYIWTSGPGCTISRVKGSTGAVDTDKQKSIPSSAILTRTRAHMQFVDEVVQYKVAGTVGGCEVGILATKIREESRWPL